jgi:signal transduction histidine kinase
MVIGISVRYILLLIMKAQLGNGVGSTTPFEAARPGIERALISTFLAIRAVHVVQGFTCVVTARSTYRRPKLAIAVGVASLAELAWIAKRDFTRGRHDPTTARIDAAFGATGLLALGWATHPADRTTSVNWMLPLTVGSTLGAAGSLELIEGAGISASLATTYAVITRESLSTGSGRAASAVANTLSYPGFFIVGAGIGRLLRHLAGVVDDARQTAIEQGARAAAEEALNKEHRRLHDSALQTLEAIASYDLDPDDLRRQARKEATLLRRAIAGEELQTTGLVAGLQELADEFANRGLNVELVTVEVEGEPGLSVAEALRDASREALTNVAKHAGVSRVVVRAASAPDGIEVTIRDQGTGFDPSAAKNGFGIDNSIMRRIAEVGGKAEISSTPGRGTRIALWAPSQYA